MNRDDVIRMAREAGLGFKKGSGWGTHSGTQRFAALIAAAEREACAQACDGLQGQGDEGYQPDAADCANAIRARGAK